MAQDRPKGGASKKLPRDRLAEALVPDPSAAPPDAVVLHGWVGNSTDPSRLRLYTTNDMRSYVEIPEAEVLHSQQLPDDQGTVVWVPRSLVLKQHTTQSAEVQAQFLSGGIAAAHLSGIGAVDTAAHVQPTPPATLLFCHPTTYPACFHSQVVACPPTLPFCPTELCPPSRWVICPTPTIHPYICFHTVLAQCPTRLACPPITAAYVCYRSEVVLCPSRICPSASIPCQTGQICPSTLACPSGPACFGAGGNPAE